MEEAKTMDHLLQRHLKSRGLLKDEDRMWCIKNSGLDGRGLFAARDIEQGEVIARDAPIIIGPRCCSKYPPMCVNCYKTNCTLFPCDGGCGLPVCSDECEKSGEHVDGECERMRKWGPKCGSMWSKDLLLAVVAVRALGLGGQDREVLMALKGHSGSIHGREIELLNSNLEGPIAQEDEEFMLKICRVMDTNAMETISHTDDTRTISLRGLYPLGAIQNHSCTPNTRHYFTRDNTMKICATVPIKKGEELTMTYMFLLSDTFLRRRYLKFSKHFECSCERCRDPTEYGSNVGAMWCADMECFGFMLPDNPLSDKSSWICQKCEKKVSSRQIKVIYSGINSIINEISFESPRKILKFVCKELKTLVPNTNHIMLDMKYRIISYFGRTEGLTFKDMTDSELEIKSKYCLDLLEVIEKLKLGDCQKKGFILYELYCTRKEKFLRKSSEMDSIEIEKLTEENKKIHDKAMEILQDDVAAPDDPQKNCNPSNSSTRTTR